jgi:hypothetical protein
MMSDLQSGSISTGANSNQQATQKPAEMTIYAVSSLVVEIGHDNMP